MLIPCRDLTHSQQSLTQVTSHSDPWEFVLLLILADQPLPRTARKVSVPVTHFERAITEAGGENGSEKSQSSNEDRGRTSVPKKLSGGAERRKGWLRGAMKDQQDRVDLISESVVKNKQRSPLAHLSSASCIGFSEDYAYLRLSDREAAAPRLTHTPHKPPAWDSNPGLQRLPA